MLMDATGLVFFIHFFRLGRPFFSFFFFMLLAPS